MIGQWTSPWKDKCCNVEVLWPFCTWYLSRPMAPIPKLWTAFPSPASLLEPFWRPRPSLSAAWLLLQEHPGQYALLNLGFLDTPLKIVFASQRLRDYRREDGTQNCWPVGLCDCRARSRRLDMFNVKKKIQKQTCHYKCAVLATYNTYRLIGALIANFNPWALGGESACGDLAWDLGFTALLLKALPKMKSPPQSGPCLIKSFMALATDSPVISPTLFLSAWSLQRRPPITGSLNGLRRMENPTYSRLVHAACSTWCKLYNTAKWRI